MTTALCLTILLVASGLVAGNRDDDSPRDYTGHRVVRIHPTTIEQVHQLRRLEQDFQMDYWNEAAEDLRPVLTLVDPNNDFFLHALNRSSIPYHVASSNFQSVIERERALMNQAFALRSNIKAGFDYENYHTYAEVMAHFKDLVAGSSGKATYLVVGTSYEKREIPAMKIGNTGPVIFFECGIHSREWVTTAFCTWVANELISGSAAAYANKYQFIVVPMLNVDGYVYTHTNDRMWRKTRSQQSGTTCRGADPNRNWDTAFCQKGASTNPCSETYCGKSAFSEVEAKAMADLVNQHKANTKAYFAIHSYSQLWMYPFGYKYDIPPNGAELSAISTAGINAIKGVNGLAFKAGTIANTIYLASGSSADYVYDAYGIKNSFALELRDKGEYGFILPANQIKPACLETWAGIKAAIDKMG